VDHLCRAGVQSAKRHQRAELDRLLGYGINGYKASDIIKERGPIKQGMFADLIAVSGDPLVDIDALRNVQFVMKNGMVFKKDGVMTPEKFFHPGPVRTPSGRWTR
jgi:imidazolonepropionase-like amidohydrolase